MLVEIGRTVPHQHQSSTELPLQVWILCPTLQCWYQRSRSPVSFRKKTYPKLFMYALNIPELPIRLIPKQVSLIDIQLKHIVQTHFICRLQELCSWHWLWHVQWLCYQFQRLAVQEEMSDLRCTRFDIHIDASLLRLIQTLFQIALMTTQPSVLIRAQTNATRSGFPSVVKKPAAFALETTGLMLESMANNNHNEPMKHHST